MSMSNSIPRPPSRWITRAAIPITIVVIAVGALLWTAWDSLVPAAVVDVVPVAARTRAASSTTAAVGEADSSGERREGAAVQAPGWIEPSPFPILVPTLTPGIVRSVHALEGARVQTGDVLVELVDEQQQIDVRRAEAEVAAALAMLRETEDEHARKSKMVAAGAASAGEVARLSLRADALRAALAAREADAAQRVLARERTKVRAPADGVVMVRTVVPGMAVSDMQDAKPLFELYDPTSLQIRADIPLADAGRVAVGDRAEISADVLPGKTMAGEVIRIVHQADIAKNTVQAKVRIIDPPSALKPDMLTRVRIMPKGSTKADSMGGGDKVALWVPSGCVQRKADHDEVLVVQTSPRGDSILDARAVETGAVDAGWTEIRAGIRAGDLAVANPSTAPPAGSRVVARESWRHASKGGADGVH